MTAGTPSGDRIQTTELVAAPPPSKTAMVLDPPLQSTGLELDRVSGKRVTGWLKVTDANCQPFKVLHGGVSALIAEGLASIGAHVASGFRRIAGIQLSINHHRSAAAGDVVFAEADALQVGSSIQVWEVHLWKMNPSCSEKEVLISSAKITFLSNMPVPENAKDAEEKIRKFAKL